MTDKRNGREYPLPHEPERNTYRHRKIPLHSTPNDFSMAVPFALP